MNITLYLRKTCGLEVGVGRRNVVCELPRLVEAGLPEIKGDAVIPGGWVWLLTQAVDWGSWCMCECVCVCAHTCVLHPCKCLSSAGYSFLHSLGVSLADRIISKCKYVLCWDCSLMDQSHWTNSFSKQVLLQIWLCHRERGAMCRSIWKGALVASDWGYMEEAGG